MRPLGLCSGFQVNQLTYFIHFFFFLYFFTLVGTLASFQSVGKFLFFFDFFRVGRHIGLFLFGRHIGLF